MGSHLDGVVVEDSKPLGKIMTAIISRLATLDLSRLCALSLALRWLFVLILKPDLNAVEDFNIAAHLVRGEGFSYGGFDDDFYPTAMKAPIYPLFLSAFIFLFGESAKLAVVLVQHALLAFTPILLSRFGKEIGLDLLGKITGLLFLAHPSFLYYPTVVEVTNLFIPLAVLWCIELIKTLRNSFNTIRRAAFGIVTGTLILTQPLVLIPIFVSLVVAFRSRLKTLALIGLCALLPISIWTLRNFLAFEKIILTKSMLYGSVYMGWLPEFAPAKKFDVIDEKTKRRIDSLRSVLNDVELEEPHKKAVWELIPKYPMLYIEKAVWQAGLYWWIPARYLDNLTIPLIAVRLLPVLILNALFLFGIVRLWKLNATFAVSIALALAYFTAVYALTQVSNIRFKLDIEWLELYACAAIVKTKSE